MTAEINKFIESSANWTVCPNGFYTDEAADREKLPSSLLQSELFKLSADRIVLREFCKKNGIPSPEFTFSDKFESLAAWAVKRNSFPLVMKTAENHSNGDFCFVLKAFRELPEFFEKVSAAKPSKIILEEFIQAKNRIEVTLVNGYLRLISQIAFGKSMLLRHAWRAYPLHLPTSVGKMVKEILKHFPNLKTLKNVPIRFSFAMSGGKMFLLSLNIGMNRLEYNPYWSKAAEIDNIFESSDSKVPQRICKIMDYFDAGTDTCPISELEALVAGQQHKIVSDEDHTTVMISCDSLNELLDKCKEVDAFFRQHQKLPSIQITQPSED